MSLNIGDVIASWGSYFVIDTAWIAFSAIPTLIVHKHTKDKLNPRRLNYTALFVFYITFVLSYTIIARTTYDTYQYNLQLFWSYKEAKTKPYLVSEIVLNYILFIPVGLFYCGSQRGRSKYVKAVIFGFILSASIECLQLHTRTGFFEFDDMFGNTCGALIGCLIYYTHRGFREAVKENRPRLSALHLPHIRRVKIVLPEKTRKHHRHHHHSEHHSEHHHSSEHHHHHSSEHHSSHHHHSGHHHAKRHYRMG